MQHGFLKPPEASSCKSQRATFKSAVALKKITPSRLGTCKVVSSSPWQKLPRRLFEALLFAMPGDVLGFTKAIQVPHPHSGVRKHCCLPKMPGVPQPEGKVFSGLQQHCIWKGAEKREGITFSVVTSSSSTYPRSWKLGSIPFLWRGPKPWSATTLSCFSCMTFSLKQLLHSVKSNLKKLRFLFQFTVWDRKKKKDFLPSELSGFSQEIWVPRVFRRAG